MGGTGIADDMTHRSQKAIPVESKFDSARRAMFAVISAKKVVMQKQYRFMALAAGLSAIPTGSAADAGIPVLVLAYQDWVMWLILPVIVLEAVILKVLNVPARVAIVGSVLANLASTVVGIPLAGLAFVLLSGGECSTLHATVTSVLARAAWLCPMPVWEANWAIPVALIGLLVLFFPISCLVEGVVFLIIFKNVKRRGITSAIVCCNAASYSLLLALPVLKLFLHK